jgi:hypothetical protein
MSESESIIKPPTLEILRACDSIDEIIQAYLNALAHAKTSRRFEAPVEVYSILKLLIRHSEAITMLARHDLIFAPAAVSIARSILEAGYRASWLLKPVDPFEREARWVLYLETAVEHHSKLAGMETLPNKVRERHNEVATSYKSFASDFRRLLNENDYTVPKKFPNFRQLMIDQSLPECYHLFVYFSAATHSNFEAMSWYRQGLGDAKQLGEFLDEEDWATPLDATGSVLFLVAEMFLRENDVDVQKHFPRSLLDKVRQRVQEIYTS